jgi:hypothetical protein
LTSLLISCGGTEEPPMTDLHIPALSMTPGCYVPPPTGFDPQGILARSVACVHAYEGIVEEMRNHPEDNAWTLTDTTLPSITTFDVQEGSRFGTEGHFVIQISSAEYGGTEDECPQSDFAFGQYAGGFAEIEQNLYSVVWTDSMVGSAVDSGFGSKVVVLLLGCDPNTGVSYGQIPREDHEDPLLSEGTSCWKSGEFVSCEGTNIWPFPEG